MRLLERKPKGKLVLTEYKNAKDVPSYLILSYTWAEDDSEEIGFQDVNAASARVSLAMRRSELFLNHFSASLCVKLAWLGIFPVRMHSLCPLTSMENMPNLSVTTALDF
jgi:hypothetical protein